MELSLAELAERIGARLEGDPQARVRGVAPLDRAGPAQVSFLANPRYRGRLRHTRAAAVILRAEERPACPVGALVADDPYLAFARAATLFAPAPPARAGIHPAAAVAPGAEVHPRAWIGPGAVVEAGARVAAGAWIGPGCVLEEGAVVGEGTRLVANVTLCHGVRVGRRCLLHPGVVVGSDGFGFARAGERWEKVPQLGSVVIGDDVEIGANTTIDRGALDDTIIEDGVKLDNQIQVAHNVVIGAHTAIAGCVGIAGSARIGRGCMIGGGAGIAGHIEIADGTVITAMSLVSHSIREPGVYSSGVPLQANREWRRNAARFAQLDRLARRLRRLERRLEPGVEGHERES